MSYSAHSTAIIDEGAIIGDRCRIWHFVHICSQAKIGNDCIFGQNVFIGNKVIIGNNVKVQNNVSIYESVYLEDNVFCGPSMVFTNVYNPRSAIPRKDEYRATHIKKGATLGANSTIICGVTVGEYAFIGAGAVVNRNVKPYALMVGVPARQIGWVGQSGKRLNLPIKGTAQVKCTETGLIYSLINGDCSCQKM